MNKFVKITGTLIAAFALALPYGIGGLEASALPAARPTGVLLPQGQSSAIREGQPVNITLKGKGLKQQGLQGQEDVLLPLELIRKGLKVKVKQDAGTNTYTLKKQNVTVTLQPAETGAKAVVDGSTQVLPYEWKVVNGQPYVSVKVLTDHLGFTSSWKDAGKTLDLIPHRLNDIRIETRTIEKNVPEATIKVEYPQVSGLRSKEAEGKINALLQSRAEKFVQASLKEAQENQPSPNGSPYEYLGNYTVTYNRGGLLSILEQTYAYTGGAHGISFREGLTFRLSDGKLLTLDEVLRANPGFRSIVDPSIAKQLQATEGYFGGFETIGNNPDFYLKENGVVIFFQLYDYLPYVFGFPEFYFSFPELGIR
ncbi:MULTISPECIES: PdaC/SigV domain-containing protein [Paenibacillus]|uniref:PdaC/SigV domain-containing protein n=1 Tax=Paenibacillus TaxID=44249 RepID=UPI002FE0E238